MAQNVAGTDFVKNHVVMKKRIKHGEGSNILREKKIQNTLPKTYNSIASENRP